jgi:predicted RNA binding protein YcfA (HicA-like mRNA interferase family)
MLYYKSMTAREIMDKLKTHGWELSRINGSHHVFVKNGCRPVSVPFHGNKDIGHFAKRILKEAGIE